MIIDTMAVEKASTAQLKKTLQVLIDHQEKQNNLMQDISDRISTSLDTLKRINSKIAISPTEIDKFKSDLLSAVRDLSSASQPSITKEDLLSFAQTLSPKKDSKNVQFTVNRDAKGYIKTITAKRV